MPIGNRCRFPRRLLFLPLRTKCILALGFRSFEHFLLAPFQECDDFEELILPVIYICEGSVNPGLIFCLFFFAFSLLVVHQSVVFCSHHTAFMTGSYRSPIESNSDVSHSGGCSRFKEREAHFWHQHKICRFICSFYCLSLCAARCRVAMFPPFSLQCEWNKQTQLQCICVRIHRNHKDEWD